MSMYREGVSETDLNKYVPPKYGAFVPHADVSISVFSKSRTRQEFADECDINKIMERYDSAAIPSHIQPREPLYLDLTDVPDFQTALDRLRDADRSFMSLPAKVRKEFDNDPATFMEFAVNPANLDQLREWGLAKPLEAPAEPMSVRIAGGRLDPEGDLRAALPEAPKPKAK